MRKCFNQQWWILFGGLWLIVACSVREQTQTTAVISGLESTTTPFASPDQTDQETTTTFTPSSSTVQASPTARFTPTPQSITPTPVATQTPEVSAVVTELPPINHDLLVLVDGSLKKWNHETGAVEVLLEGTEISEVDGQGKITRFQVDAEERSLVAARQTGDDPPTYALIWFNLESETFVNLVTDLPYLLDFEVALDGQRVAYTVGDPASLGDIGNGYTYPFKGSIYWQDLAQTQQSHFVGECTNVNSDGVEKSWPGCLSLIWSIDSQQVIWADARGVWQYELNAPEASLLQPSLYNLDIGNFEQEVNVFNPLDWSPSGRYLRLEVRQYEGGRESILDLETNQLMEIPYTFAYEGPVVTSLTWTQDDHLFMVRTEGTYGEFVNYAEFWRVAPEQGELVLEQSIPIPTGFQAYVSEATQLGDGAFTFAVFSFEEGDETAGLYWLEPEQGVPQKVNPLPSQIPYAAATFWTPNGDGALVVWYQDDFVYVKSGDESFYDMRPLLGDSIASDRGLLQVKWLN